MLGKVQGVLCALVVSTLGTGQPALAAAPSDQVALFDPATGQFTQRHADATTSSFFFGTPGDTPLLGDWDCDGIDTVAMYRSSNGFIYLRNSNSQGVAEREFFYGLAGDVPLAGDWSGDGCDTFAIYRPGEGRVYIRNTLGTGVADYSFYFGMPGDRPFSGDWNGDGIDSMGLYRETTGFAYLRNPNTQGVADLEFFYGEPADRIVAGDWDADGDDTVGVYRPADARFYLSNANRQGIADLVFPMGSSSWLPVAGYPGETTGLPTLALETVATGFTQPLFLTAPAGDARLFVVEKTGRVKLVAAGSVSTFLDLSAIVSTNGERGLLGMAFHPAYQSNGRFFVSYTDPSGDSRVAEYRVSADPDRADPAQVRQLLAVDQPYSNHNGGMIQFGPDGLLYLGLGDGGGAGDPHNNAQNDASLLGKLVRMNVDTGTAEIWAKGLRNPWRWDFDQASGLIYIADVGQSDWEEVNIAPAAQKGLNYGWPTLEGSHCYDPPAGCATNGFVLPSVEYPHPEGLSVTGGFVYRGDAVAGLNGAYLYSDFATGFLRGFRYEAGAITAVRDWTAELGDLGPVASFGEDGSGELYVLTLDGAVRKIVAGA